MITLRRTIKPTGAKLYGQAYVIRYSSMIDGKPHYIESTYDNEDANDLNLNFLDKVDSYHLKAYRQKFNRTEFEIIEVVEIKRRVYEDPTITSMIRFDYASSTLTKKHWRQVYEDYDYWNLHPKDVQNMIDAEAIKVFGRAYPGAEISIL